VDAVTVLVSLSGALVSSGGVGVVVNALAKKRTNKADAAETLTDTALTIVAALKADAASARLDSTAVRKEMSAVRDQVEALGGKLRRLIATIHEPAMTIEQLRIIVPLLPSQNGSGRD
jgi:predicted amino acid-binding ACT domain protein